MVCWDDGEGTGDVTDGMGDGREGMGDVDGGVWGLVKDLGVEVQVNINGVKMMEIKWMVVSQNFHFEYLKYKSYVTFKVKLFFN